MWVGKSPSVARAAEELYARLGSDILFDDREESVSRKFKDCDLLGIPYRLVVSGATVRDGTVELRRRACGTEQVLPIDEALAFLRERFTQKRQRLES